MLLAVLVLAAGLLTAVPAGGAPARCSPVALFAVPGTGESDSEADPGLDVGLLSGLTVPASERNGDDLLVEYLAYPASLDRPLPYVLSELRGVEALDRRTGAHHQRCPDSRIVLVGYSQGADVVDDLVHRAQRGTVAIRPEDIAGAVMLGSPRRNPDAPNLVPAPGRGVLGPRPTRELDVYSGRVREVCAVDDPICASESFDLSELQEGLASGAHRSYPTLPVGAAGTPLYDLLGSAIDDLVVRAGQDGPDGPATLRSATGTS